MNDNNVSAVDDETGTTEFVIESDIPIPARSHFASKYPWANMQVGDSFFIARENRNRRSLAVLPGNASKRYSPKRFIGRSCTRNGVQGLRVWRVE